MDSPLAVWLKEKNLTQAQLARLAGCSQGWVGPVVRGDVRASGRVGEYLRSTCPDVMIEQEKYYQEKGEELKRRVAA